MHFLALGLGLFVLHAIVGPGDPTARTITISADEIADLRRQYAALWNRPPSEAQLATLIENQVRDEILYREGVALGLGADDPVIKRRIRQKIEVMAEEEGSDAAATDIELQAYMHRRPDKFGKPAVVSFDQVYFNPQGPDTPTSVAAAKARLAAGAPPSGFGQATLLPTHIASSDTDLVARDFGRDFAAVLVKLPVGQWAGPIGSGVGVHLVRLTALAPPRVPALAEVREMVVREWENDRRIAASEANYKRAREKYGVVIEGRQ